METNKFEDNNYYQVQGWMANKLNIKGNDLLIFALVYGFSQDGKSWFYGSINYIASAIGASRNTVLSSIETLVNRSYIVKKQIEQNGVIVNFYRYNKIHVDEMLGSANSGIGVVQKLTRGSANSAPNNYIYNNINNILMSKIEISDDLKEFTITEKGIKTKIETDENTGKYFKIAEAFRHRFINNLNDAGAPTVHQENATFKNYVHPIRMLLEKDKVSKEKLHDVYVFLGSEEGSFWKPNILSTKTLRDKISKLITQEVQSKQRQSKNTKNNFSNNPGI